MNNEIIEKRYEESVDEAYWCNVERPFYEQRSVEEREKYEANSD